MKVTSHRQTIEDHVLMAHAYAKSMGTPSALDLAEATIQERRDSVATEYTAKIRDTVTVLFMRAECKDLGEYIRQARDFESGWWALFDSQGNVSKP